MKALVLDGKVVQLAKAEFPVSRSLKWVEVKDVTPAIGWGYDGEKFSAPPPPPAERTPEYATLRDQYNALWITMIESTIGYIAQEPNYTLQNIKNEFAQFKAIVAEIAALKAGGGPA